MEELLKQIDGLSIETDVKELLKNSVASEVQSYRDKLYSKDKENLKLKDTFKKLGKDSGEQYDTFVESLLEKMSTTEKKVEEKDLTLSSLNEKLTNALSQLDDIKTEKEKAIKSKNELKVKNVLNEHFNNKVYGQKFLVDSIIAQNSFNVDNDNITFGEDNQSVEDFVKNVLETNKDILMSEQKGGSASDAGDGDVPKTGDIVDQLKQRMNLN